MLEPNQLSRFTAAEFFIMVYYGDLFLTKRKEVSRYKTYFDLIRYSLNLKDEMLKDVAKMDWEGFFRFADEQGILGLTADGRRLMADGAGLTTL